MSSILVSCLNGGLQHIHPSKGDKKRCNRRLRESGTDAVVRHERRDSSRRDRFVKSWGKTFAEMSPDERKEYHRKRQVLILERHEDEDLRESLRDTLRHRRHLFDGRLYGRNCILCDDFIFRCLKDGCWNGKEDPQSHLQREHPLTCEGCESSLSPLRDNCPSCGKDTAEMQF